MAGLFNLPTPEAVRQSARDSLFKRSAAIAAAPDSQRLLAAQGGGLLGQAVGEEFGTRNIDPEIEGIRAVQQATESFITDNNIDTTTPEGQLQMLNKAGELGRRAGISKIYEAADAQAMKVQELIGKNAKATATKPSTKLMHMKELMEQGLDEKTAQGIAFGTIKSMVDPTSGDVITVDLRNTGKESDKVTETVREGARRGDLFDKKVTDFAKGIEKSGITQQESALADVEQQFAKFDKDLPGVGQTAILPDWMITKGGKDLRQTLQTMFNMTLKDRSGAAVTTPEMDRLKKEFGAGAFKTDDQLRTAVTRFRRALEAHKNTLAAGAKDDVVKEFQGRGGIFLKPFSSGTLVWDAASGRLVPKGDK